MQVVLAGAVIWGGVAAFINTERYKRGQMNKREAVLDTAGESAPVGLAAATDFWVSNILKVSLFASSASLLLPAAFGIASAVGVRFIWKSASKKNLKYGDLTLKKDKS